MKTRQRERLGNGMGCGAERGRRRSGGGRRLGVLVHVDDGEAQEAAVGAAGGVRHVERGREVRVLAVGHALRLPQEPPAAAAFQIAFAAAAAAAAEALRDDAHGVALAQQVRVGQVCRGGAARIGSVNGAGGAQASRKRRAM